MMNKTMILGRGYVMRPMLAAAVGTRDFNCHVDHQPEPLLVKVVRLWRRVLA